MQEGLPLTPQASSEIDQDLYAELRGDSERAAVIFGAAVLDELLRQVLEAFMIADDNEISELIGDSRPLGTFAARTRAAYCLGLIDDEEKHDLEIIRRIRNPFAHLIRTPSFEKEGELRDRALSLQIGKRFLNNQQRTSPRSCFEATTAALAYSLSVRPHQVKRERRKVRST